MWPVVLPTLQLAFAANQFGSSLLQIGSHVLSTDINYNASPEKIPPLLSCQQSILAIINAIEMSLVDSFIRVNDCTSNIENCHTNLLRSLFSIAVGKKAFSSA